MIGGWSTGVTHATVNGAALTSHDGLDIRHNSPDLNGDGVVDLADIEGFAADYGAANACRSDLWNDGTVDLNDLSLLARSLDAQCP